MSCIELILAAIIFLNPGWSEGRAKIYATPICREAEKRDIDPLIVVSIIQHESNWRKSTVYHNKNGSKDIGLMQFNCRPMHRIDLKWRRWWCHQDRRARLKTVSGNIRAGVLELSFWKKICHRKHREKGWLLYSNPPIDTVPDCRDCFSAALVPKYIKFNKHYLRLKKVLSEHWWIQHYNWRSEKYSLGVMYIYLALRNEVKHTYKTIKRRRYPHILNLRECLMRRDLCSGD